MQSGRLFSSDLLTLNRGLGQSIAMVGVGLAQRLVPVRLSGLRQQDQRSRIGGLQGEGEIQQDERLGVPTQRHRDHVGHDPKNDQHRLTDQKPRRPEENGRKPQLDARTHPTRTVRGHDPPPDENASNRRSFHPPDIRIWLSPALAFGPVSPAEPGLSQTLEPIVNRLQVMGMCSAIPCTAAYRRSSLNPFALRRRTLVITSDGIDIRTVAIEWMVSGGRLRIR